MTGPYAPAVADARQDRGGPSPLRQWPAWVPVVIVAAVVGFIGVIGTLHIEPSDDERATDAVAFVLVGLGTGSLLLRRRWPLATLAVATGCVAVYIVREYPGGPIYLLVPVALYSFAAAVDRRTGYLAAGAVVGLLSVVRVLVEGRLRAEYLVLVGWGAVAVLAADAVRSRRERAAAERERLRFAEEHREEELRRRIAEDRLLIARDLHDSVAHSMATINVQSGVASHVIERHPEKAKDALEAIRIASRDVIDELGAMLSVLRDEVPAGRQPTPDLAALAGLVESSRAAGLVVDLHTEGDLAAVSRPMSTAAFRIVQEALTNVIRHARVGHAAVTVARHEDGGLDVEVVDEGVGPATASSGAGMGLTGIRERAEITAGRAVIGPRPGGGFRVAVSWPARS